MSDFLDRLAARAIGSETVLAPRLPSLFEPLQRAPIMPLVEAGEAPSQHREATPPIVAQPTEASARSAHPTALAPPAPSRIVPVEPMPPPTPARSTTSTSRGLVQPGPVDNGRVSSPVVERAVLPGSSAPPTVAIPPLRVPPRQSRIAPDRHAPASSPQGVLLPSSAPVFASSRAVPAPARSGQAVALRPRNAQSGSRNEGISEPVVHVSIGRLEVRAAPVVAASPRRRDGPQPGSLDDYLRQRGGKASP